MFIEVASDGARIHEPEVLTSLSVRVADGTDHGGLAAALGDLGTVDGDHAWLSVAALRARAEAARSDVAGVDAWRQGFDGMIAYAASKGWVADGTVRAHLERSPG